MIDSPPCYGATREEWALFDVVMGLTADLLPVVANPGATISPASNMKEKGKVPSQYNRHGHVAGIADWTRRVADEVDMERWYKQADYGICIQTREVRALDIDVPDANVVAKIQKVVYDHLRFLPRRYRDNSNKTLLAFRIKGDIPKRVIKLREKLVDTAGKVVEPAWLIEFLATGQQFVAAGTHPSGARIEWDWQALEDFPEITLEQFDLLWKELTEKFAIEKPAVGGVRKRGEYINVPDVTAEEIIKRGLDLGEGNDGQIFIECPWKDGHSMDSGTTETAYFPRGTGGYELGHFRCMHAGCASRSDTDFEEEMGLRDNMFDNVPVPVDEKGKPVLEMPRFERGKNGEIEATLYNLEQALARPDICGREVKFDIFRDSEMVRPLDTGVWREMSDGDAVKLRKHLERYGFKSISRELMRDALTSHAEDHKFDTAIEWLNTIPAWDGVGRVDRFLTEYYGSEDTPYAKAVSAYMWTALAGRVLVPGIKADMAPILQGEQGVLKSTAVAALVPWNELFAELSLGDKEEKLNRLMRGKLVIELGELRGLHTKELEAIKAFTVRRYDIWVPKYRERHTTFARRCIFIGTTNQSEFLADETGNRRFLPIRVEKADIKAIERDRLQLWAEGRARFMAGGIEWSDAEKLGKGEHEKFAIHDSWQENIITWLDIEDMTGTKPKDKEYILTSEVLQNALNIDPKNVNPMNEKRVAKVLKTLGYFRAQKRFGSRVVKVFKPSQQ